MVIYDLRYILILSLKIFLTLNVFNIIVKFMIIKWIAKTLVAINSNTKPQHIALGIAFALLLALMPAGNLLWIFIFAMTFFLKLNLSVEFVFLALFKLLAVFLDGILHSIGYFILTIPALESFFIAVREVPVLSFTRFNNTIVMGGFAAGLLLFIPVYLLFKFLVIKYRSSLREKLANSKFVKGFLKLPIVSFLKKLFSGVYGFYSKIR